MKNMRSPEELAELLNDPKAKLTDVEERLADLHVFHTTGKRTEKFKDKRLPVEPGVTLSNSDLWSKTKEEARARGRKAMSKPSKDA